MTLYPTSVPDMHQLNEGLTASVLICQRFWADDSVCCWSKRRVLPEILSRSSDASGWA